MSILDRLGQEKLNNQGSLMKIIECNKSSDILVEFQDEYKAKVNTTYGNFKSSSIKNPYYPSICGVGRVGNKYLSRINSIQLKEYVVWTGMLDRCFNQMEKDRSPTYKDVTCCDEWLLYENFYEWLHNQENFDKLKNSKRWALDKDILNKRNKVYSPDTCCLVPQNVNCLFLKREAERGNYPIGVSYRREGFIASCHNPFTNQREELGSYSTPEKAFEAYKIYKGDIIKRVAEIEFSKGNITRECYEAMINYKVEIDD